jgi:1-acyl-sn-glycerol-3-phosphate acyltransferase
MYSMVFPLLKLFMTPLYQVEHHGLENIPASGAVIMAGNHTQNSDPFMIAFGLPVSRPIAFMAKAEMFVNPISNWAIRSVHQFPVNRGAPDRGAIRHALGILKQGGVLGIFPQGTRSEPGEVTEAHAGVAFFALQSQAPVVSVGISRIHVPGLIRHQKATVVYGNTIDPADFAELPKKERTAAMTERIVAGINEALAEADRIGARR